MGHWPYRPQTKGKVKSGVKYMQRNALAGKRLTRVHRTTHEVPSERFAREQLSSVSAAVRRAPCVGARAGPTPDRRSPDSLVTISGSHYSVPAPYVGESVSRYYAALLRLRHDDLWLD